MKISCPNCGSNIIYDVYKEKVYCETCNSFSPIFDVDIDKYYNKNTSLEEYSCSSCGARIATENTSTVTKCAFCNSTQIIPQKLSKNFKPNYIVPFKIDKDSFKERYMEYVKDFRFLPKGFKNADNIEDVNGIYVPYYLYYLKSKVDYKGSIVGIVDNSFQRIKKSYEAEEDVKIINDASVKLDDNITSSVEPYDLSNEVVKDFNPIYLLGFQSELPNENEEVLRKSVIKKCLVNALNPIKKVFVNKILNTGKLDVNIDFKEERELLLLPIWYANIKYKSKKVPIAINGQTGKVVANFPVNTKRIFFIKAILFIIGILSLIICLNLPIKLNLGREILTINSNESTILGIFFIGSLSILASIWWDVGIKQRYRLIHSSINSNVNIIKRDVLFKGETTNYKRKECKDHFKRPFNSSLSINGEKIEGRIISKIMKRSRREDEKVNPKFYYFSK